MRITCRLFSLLFHHFALVQFKPSYISSMAKGRCIPFLVVTILFLSDNVVGFPKQPVFVTNLDGDDNVGRERRNVYGSGAGSYYDYSAGDYELEETDVPGVEPVTPKEPVPPIKIRSLHVLSSTTARFTNTSVTSKLVNSANVSQETEVNIRLPDEAFITELFIEVDGKVYRSKVETKEKAQKIYDAARESGKTASQVKQTSEKTNDFSVSINVESQSAVKCTLIYQQLLVRKKGYFENKISIRPKQIISDLRVNAYINEPQGLDEVKFWLQKEEGNDVTDNVLKEQSVNLTSPTRAHIQFHPSKTEQRAQSNHGIVGDFVIRYDVVHSIDGGNIQVVNGYFVHYFSPEGLPAVNKNVVFVIDVSGSMSGTKIRQTREAMLSILDQLREGDTFNIVTFCTDIETWMPGEMVPVTPDNIKSAKEFSRNLRALSSTNFYGGIEQGVSMLDNFHESTNSAYINKTLSMIITLSDGQPTAGITDLEEIKRHTLALIKEQYSLFNLGFGNDVDSGFLEKLAGQNGGIFRKIYVDSDSALQLASFFDDVATPLLLNVEFNYRGNVIENNEVTETSFPSYFMGSELVVAGKLNNEVFNIDEPVICDISGWLTEVGIVGIESRGTVQVSSEVMLHPHAVGNFTQRLWAYLTIKEMLGKRRISDDNEEKEGFKERALELSLKYHFVTPLTSLVVVKPENNDTTETTPNDADIQTSHDQLSYQVTSGSSRKQGRGQNLGFPGPRGPQGPQVSSMMNSPNRGLPTMLLSTLLIPIGSADSDPHFLVYAPRGNVSICFNLMAKAGTILNLISDAPLGLFVNAKVQRAIPHPILLKKKKVDLAEISKRTVFTEMALVFMNRHILISSSGIDFSGMTLPWTSNWYMVDDDGFSIAVTDGKFLHVTLREDLKLVFMLHAVNKKHPAKSDYLGVYVLDGSGFSDNVHGIVGQFHQHEVRLYTETIREDSTTFDKTAILRVNDHTVEVKHASRKVLLTGELQTCWFGKDDGAGLIDGTYNNYLRNELLSTE